MNPETNKPKYTIPEPGLKTSGYYTLSAQYHASIELDALALQKEQLRIESEKFHERTNKNLTILLREFDEITSTPHKKSIE